jgi:TPR repeat protein
MSKSGEGTPQDLALAFKWYEKAANGGNPKAQYNLSVMLYDGKGAQKDEEAALECLRMSAKLEHAEAIKLLNKINDFKDNS